MSDKEYFVLTNSAFQSLDSCWVGVEQLKDNFGKLHHLLCLFRGRPAEFMGRLAPQLSYRMRPGDHSRRQVPLFFKFVNQRAQTVLLAVQNIFTSCFNYGATSDNSVARRACIMDKDVSLARMESLEYAFLSLRELAANNFCIKAP